VTETDSLYNKELRCTPRWAYAVDRLTASVDSVPADQVSGPDTELSSLAFKSNGVS
jgi:hypothetical protein